MLRLFVQAKSVNEPLVHCDEIQSEDWSGQLGFNKFEPGVRLDIVDFRLVEVLISARAARHVYF